MRNKTIFIAVGLLFSFILVETALALPPPPPPPSDLGMNSIMSMPPPPPPPPPGGTMDGQPGEAPREGGREGGPGKKRGQKQRGLKPRNTTIGVDVSYSEDTKVYNIPLSHSFAPNFQLAVSIPYISTTDSGEGLGNTLVSAKYFTGVGKEFFLLATAGIYYATSNAELGLSQTDDGYLGLSGYWNIKGSRIMGSVSAIFRPDNYSKKGDYQSAFLGFDTPTDFLISQTSFYASAYASQTGEDKYNGMALGNEQTLVDATVGVLLRRWNIRIGVTIPVSTESDVYDNSDRDISYDTGYRYTY